VRNVSPTEPLDGKPTLLTTGIAASCDVVTVQRALGHAATTTTLRTYAHLWPTAEDRTRNAASELMRSATSREYSADSLRTNHDQQGL